MATLEEHVHELTGAEAGTLATLNKSEIDQQIATARRYPRSTLAFMRECMGLATISEAVADECFYALPRDGKMIEGPSARFAEIVAHCWGNARVGARVIDDQGEFVTAQGVFHDLEKNVQITYEVKRRIVDKHGRRFKPDMIGVTSNAACSIALRNAVFKGVPKAIWNSIYLEVRKVAAGDAQTLTTRRASILAALAKLGATREQIFSALAVQGEEDITLDHIVTLKGMGNAIKDGDSSVEMMFPQPETSLTQRVVRKTATRPAAIDDPIEIHHEVDTRETIGAQMKRERMQEEAAADPHDDEEIVSTRDANQFADLLVMIDDCESLEMVEALCIDDRPWLNEAQEKTFTAAVARLRATFANQRKKN